MCESCGGTRRAVQGYEKYGLIAPTGKTDRGYLLYNEATMQETVKIKQLQNYGFSLQEIVDFRQKAPQEQKSLLREKRERLLRRKAEIERCLREIEKMIE